MRNLNVLLSLGLVFFFHAACNGDVVIDPEGPDGSETSGVDSSKICQEYCSARVQTGCAEDEAPCLAACEEYFKNAGACASVYGEIYKCAMENPGQPPACSTPSQNCEPERDAYAVCVASAACEEQGLCEVKASGCHCTNDCSGALLESDCKFAPDGTTTCTCSFNGKVVGSCTAGGEKCNNLNGCCAGIFAESH